MGMSYVEFVFISLNVLIFQVKKGPQLDSEVLSLRGDELNHYSANSNQVFLHI